MVGRLVEEEDVGLAQKNLGQFDAHAPAARKLARGAAEVGAAEAQALERAVDLGLVVLAAEEHVAVVEVGEALHLGKLFHECQIAFALIVSTFCQFLIHPVKTFLQLGVVSESLARFFPDGGVVLQFHHLGQVANGGALWHSHGACGGLLQSA